MLNSLSLQQVGLSLIRMMFVMWWSSCDCADLMSDPQWKRRWHAGWFGCVSVEKNPILVLCLHSIFLFYFAMDQTVASSQAASESIWFLVTISWQTLFPLFKSSGPTCCQTPPAFQPLNLFFFLLQVVSSMQCISVYLSIMRVHGLPPLVRGEKATRAAV